MICWLRRLCWAIFVCECVLNKLTSSHSVQLNHSLAFCQYIHVSARQNIIISIIVLALFGLSSFLSVIMSNYCYFTLFFIHSNYAQFDSFVFVSFCFACCGCSSDGFCTYTFIGNAYSDICPMSDLHIQTNKKRTKWIGSGCKQSDLISFWPVRLFVKVFFVCIILPIHLMDGEHDIPAWFVQKSTINTKSPRIDLNRFLF